MSNIPDDVMKMIIDRLEWGKMNLYRNVSKQWRRIIDYNRTPLWLKPNQSIIPTNRQDAQYVVVRAPLTDRNIHQHNMLCGL
jgi:multimeric flavodoxin WrbA